MSNYAILVDIIEKHYEIIECCNPKYYFNKCIEKESEMQAKNEILGVKVHMLDYTPKENEECKASFIEQFTNNNYTESVVFGKII